jgi:hypothetical protein
VRLPARAPAPGQVVLVPPGRPRLRDVLLLIGPGDARPGGIRQVGAALAVPLRAAGLRPGRSSLLGGIEEFPEFLVADLKAASSCPRSAVSAAICSSWATSRAACPRISASRGSSGGSDSVTPRDHPRNQPRPPRDTPPAAQP